MAGSVNHSLMATMTFRTMKLRFPGHLLAPVPGGVFANSTSRSAQLFPIGRNLHQKAWSFPRIQKELPLWTLAPRNISRRGYQSYPSAPPPPLQYSSAEIRQRLIYGAAIFGGTLVAVNLVFNQEGRDDGGMPEYERKYLNDTFLHLGLGLGMVALGARTLHTRGWSIRLMTANPWLVAGLGLVGSVGSMYATRAIDPDNYIPKYALWSSFNLTQALFLSPLMFLNPAILYRAALYATGTMGSLAIVGSTAKQDKYLYLGGPLLAGVTVVALSGLAPMVLPMTATRTLAFTQNIWLYGGLAVFGGLTLYDVQKVLHHARLAHFGKIKPDPVNESIGLELDFINLFVRIVQILAMRSGSQGNQRK